MLARSWTTTHGDCNSTTLFGSCSSSTSPPFSPPTKIFSSTRGGTRRRGRRQRVGSPSPSSTKPPSSPSSRAAICSSFRLSSRLRPVVAIHSPTRPRDRIALDLHLIHRLQDTPTLHARRGEGGH